MSDFFLLCLYSLSLRWFVFRYKHTAFFRNWLASFKHPVLEDLLKCPYCQTIEISVLVYALLIATGDLGIQASHLFSILANGWIAIVIDDWVERAIERMESTHASQSKAVGSEGWSDRHVGFQPTVTASK